MMVHLPVVAFINYFTLIIHAKYFKTNLP